MTGAFLRLAVHQRGARLRLVLRRGAFLRLVSHRPTDHSPEGGAFVRLHSVRLPGSPSASRSPH